MLLALSKMIFQKHFETIRGRNSGVWGLDRRLLLIGLNEIINILIPYLFDEVFLYLI